MGYLVLLLTVVPAVELIVLIEVGSVIGSVNTILIIVLTGVVGAYLARIQGFYIFQRVNSSLQSGNMPTEEMMDGLMVLVGGILLLTPGFITDIFGFSLLIPATRALIKRIIRNHFNRMIDSGQINSFNASSFSKDSSSSHLNSNDNAEDADYS